MKLRGKLIKKMLQVVGSTVGITFSVLSCIFMFNNISFLTNNIGMIQAPVVLKYLSFSIMGFVGIEIGTFFSIPLLQDLFYEEHKTATLNKNNKNYKEVKKTQENEKLDTLKDNISMVNTAKKDEIVTLEKLKEELLNCKIDEEINKEEKIVRIKK